MEAGSQRVLIYYHSSFEPIAGKRWCHQSLLPVATGSNKPVAAALL